MKIDRYGRDCSLIPTEGAGAAFYQIDEQVLSTLHRRAHWRELLKQISTTGLRKGVRNPLECSRKARDAPEAAHK